MIIGTDIDVIPPLMLTSLHAADKDERGKIVDINARAGLLILQCISM